MSTIIYYNGVNAFSDAIATPLVAMTSAFTYVNSNISRVKTFTLTGKIKKTTCTDGFNGLYLKQQALIDKFSKKFSVFKIEENGVTIFNHDYAIPRSVEFDESSYYNLISFTVTIDCYDYNYANNGILEPSDEITSQENNDGTVNWTRAISCRGINNSNSAFQNCKNFLVSQEAQATRIPAGAILTSRIEKPNRLTAEYSIELTYIFDPQSRQGASNPGVLKYTIETSQNENTIQVAVSGTISGGLNYGPKELRAAYQNINWYNLALAEYNSSYSDGELSQAADYQITEDYNAPSISFSITFDNLSNRDAYKIETTTISKNYTTGETCLSYQAEFRADYGCKRQRYVQVQALFNSSDIDALAETKWNLYGVGRMPSKPKSKSISYDEINAIIVASVTFCSSNLEDCGCLEQFQYTLNFTPSINKYAANPSLNGEGCYYIQDLGYKNRFRFGISGQFVNSRCCTNEEARNELLSKLNYLLFSYFPATDIILETDSISYNDSGAVSFSFQWNGLMEFEPPEIFTTIEEAMLLENEEEFDLENGEVILIE